ncbi:uncharacterized protein PRCAT00001808001 [Priceomyces carsonii]|uniref:uncharacterized protein n=1 Tax=Priceomyces carsonii TaxID=28549 RepID=UPI002EDBA4AC|nr:unnamed protein product [Priceomyces carsonii]
MTSTQSLSAYCFVSNNSVHFVPINTFNNISDIILDQINDQGTDTQKAENQSATGNIILEKEKHMSRDRTSDHLSPEFKYKNLLYNLNNPSLSDIDSDSPNENTINKVDAHRRKGVREHSTNFELSGQSISNIIENYSTHAVYWPKLSIDLTVDMQSGYEEIKEFLLKLFPDWKDSHKIKIKQLTGGITNMLLQCIHIGTKETKLMRVYGPGTNIIIDRDREFILHLILNSLSLAPPIHARFKNGLVYGFLPGKSLDPEELSKPNIYPLIAQQLGNWHRKLDTRLIESGVEELRNFRAKKLKKKFISNIWELIEEWINIVPITSNLLATFDENLEKEINKSNIRDLIKEEFYWLKGSLVEVHSPTVSCHCDLLSGNIIIPSEFSFDDTFKKLPKVEANPIKFIDYEYILPAPRAFDIANHFAEWQGFDCNRSAIPEPSVNNPMLVKWVKSYLDNELATEDEVVRLIEEIKFYFGLPGFYWGIWAMIQSEISNIDFNYANYGKLRLQEYWDWKSLFLKGLVTVK